MSLSIKAMTYFLTAAEKGSITEAAETLNVAASAISSAMKTVEDEFDLQLVLRYPAKGIVPTASGRIIMRKIRHVLDEFEAMLVEGADLRRAPTGKLSIGYYVPIGPGFLPEILAPLTRDNQSVQLALHDSDNDRAQAGLLAGTYDLIVFVAENVRSSIQCEILADAPPYLLVRKGHPFEDKDYVAFDELQEEPMVILDLPVVRDYYLGLLNEYGVDAQIAATASSTEMVRSLVGAGYGSAILNMRPRTDITYAGNAVSAVPLSPGARALKVQVGYLGGRQRRLVRLAIDACKNYFDSGKAEPLTVRATSKG